MHCSCFSCVINSLQRCGLQIVLTQKGKTEAKTPLREATIKCIRVMSPIKQDELIYSPNMLSDKIEDTHTFTSDLIGQGLNICRNNLSPILQSFTCIAYYPR